VLPIVRGRALIVLALALVSACSGDAAEKPRAAPAPKTPALVAVEIFGTRQITREQLLATQAGPLRALEAAVVAGVQPATELLFGDELQALGDFAYARPALVGYFEPEGMQYYLTVDFVDRADAARRMPFAAAPQGTYADPEGLLADWRAYEEKQFELLHAGRTSPARTPCPAFHCLGDHAHPELAPFAENFVARVPAHADELATILRDDADPLQRAAAVYLLAYATDGEALVRAMVGAFRDGDDLVRNNAMRVVAEIALHHPELDVPLEPVLEALEYPATLDRNKAAAILAWLLERPGAAPLQAASARRAAPTLLAMLRLAQPNNHDFAYDILKAISGQRFGEHDHAAWEAWFDEP
jgi:hypothetical protein